MGTDTRLSISTLENWLWEAACVIRGPLDAPKFKDYILPLIFLKRLSDVFDDELDHLGAELGGRDTAAALVEDDKQLVRFYVPENARWAAIQAKTSDLGQYLTDAARPLCASCREAPRCC